MEEIFFDQETQSLSEREAMIANITRETPGILDFDISITLTWQDLTQPYISICF